MKTIAEQWLEFSTLVLPDNVADVQRTEMRRAFYAGFTAALHSMREFPDDMPDADGVAQLEKWSTESHEFYERVKAGRA